MSDINTLSQRERRDDDELVFTSIRVPNGLLKAARKAAIDQEISLQQVVEDALRLLLGEAANV
jgi:hypothetical protein